MYVLSHMAHRTRNTARILTNPTALRAARLRRFMSPEDLARASKVGLGTIKAGEGKAKSVHLSTIEKLASALRCNPSEISTLDVSETEEAV